MQVRDKFFSSLVSLRAAAQMTESTEVGIIHVGKKLDHNATLLLKERFKQFVSEGRQRHIIDLTKLDVLDSGGLAGLISALRAVRETGGSVDLVANSTHVTQILELTSLTRLFKVHRSMQAALAAV
jgi:anti-sigma B factor antagonist